MTDIASGSKCRKCGRPIYWHKSKTGRNYPTDSATDRRAFHQCEALAQPKPVLQPTATSDFEETLEGRVESLEKQVAQLARTIQAVQAQQPIGESDVAF